ncbi:LOW QUALITY PROTEIN: carboxymethylenebutenolidase homolog [Phaethornis superciliosus]
MADELRPCPCDIGDRFDYGGCGQEVQIEHIKAYVCKPPASTGKAVIVIHDIFGWQLPNTRYMTDMLADNGYVLDAADLQVKVAFLNDSLEVDGIRICSREDDAVLKYLKDQCGVKKFGVVGFCWGGVGEYIYHVGYAELHPQVTSLEQKLKKNCKDIFKVKIYPGKMHDSVHREDTNLQDKPCTEEGRKDVISWLNK